MAVLRAVTSAATAFDMEVATPPVVRPSTVMDAGTSCVIRLPYLAAAPLIFSMVRRPPKPSMPIRIGSISVMSAGASASL